MTSHQSRGWQLGSSQGSTIPSASRAAIRSVVLMSSILDSPWLALRVMLALYPSYRHCQPLFLKIFLVNCVQIDRIVSHHIAVLTLGGIKTNVNFSVIVSLKANHHSEDSVERHHFHFSVVVILANTLYIDNPHRKLHRKKKNICQPPCRGARPAEPSVSPLFSTTYVQLLVVNTSLANI